MKRFLYIFSLLFLILSLFTFCEQQTASYTDSANKNTTPEFKRSPSTSPDATESATSGEIYIAVDESIAPLIQAELDNFQAVHEKAIVHALIMPAEDAIRAMLLSDSIRLVITTRKLNREEENLLKALTVPPDYATLGKDAVAVIVNPENPTNQLKLDQLKAILSGEIKTWKDISGNSTAGNISLIFDHARSGIISFLRDSLMDGKPLPEASTFALKNTEEVINYVAENPGATGIVGMAWLSDKDDPKVLERLKKIKILSLEKSAHTDNACAYKQTFFGPFQSFLDQDCYPLTRKMYSISRESGIGLGTGFVAYIDGPLGQKIIHKSGLAAIHTIPRKVKFPEEETPPATTQQKPTTAK
ncbi:MAG: substrate-binding domain-containing protein [Bacteroidia bacterium]|nr:substrate-binding domain-containing protein [Bacteroidia bacterium]